MVFSSPSSRAVSFSSYSSAWSMACCSGEPGVMSCSLGVIFPKYRSSSMFRMCAASFATTHDTTKMRNSQGFGAELSNNSHFLRGAELSNNSHFLRRFFLVYGISVSSSGRDFLSLFRRRNF